ncbi:hypothetical protein FHR33_000195 [Nonomuraea dietziae]|uniref:Uncharacterized protein n=1 Tax=Nonomuraea dietziae TaxID=65515 RepID=A0A7W5V3U3_9ACTN|nr:hypothetical protein [Nonomuraea dietziae]
MTVLGRIRDSFRTLTPWIRFSAARAATAASTGWLAGIPDSPTYVDKKTGTTVDRDGLNRAGSRTISACRDDTGG